MTTESKAVAEVQAAARQLGIDMMSAGYEAASATMFRLSSSPDLQTVLPARRKNRDALMAFLRTALHASLSVSAVFGSLMTQIEAVS